MIETIVGELKKNPRFRKQIEHVHVEPARPPRHGPEPERLPAGIRKYLAAGKLRLYEHQWDLLAAARAGENAIISTPTASGKTLAFNLPIFEGLTYGPDATALYLYPTKALANDQLKSLRELDRIAGTQALPDIYDGDTPAAKRPGIRNRSRIILSNPHELHQVLPWHYKWERFFKNLKFVAIDEAHRYRGILGSNTAFLMRRLQRVCRNYGAAPQFILSSATLANPLAFAEKLTGAEFRLIDRDGSPRGRKFFIFYNPYRDPADRLSPAQETRDLFVNLTRAGLQTLCFTQSRKMAESLSMWSQKDLLSRMPGLADKVASYRAGYLPHERREIENALKTGKLRGITATNALELGIDIGSLDAVIISGYPGTVISMWQQAGRSGRGERDSLAVFVALEDALDQYFMKHPAVFFGTSLEHAIVDTNNPHITAGHVMCAAAELPVNAQTESASFAHLPQILSALQNQGLVKQTPRGWVYSGKQRPSEVVSLDGIASDVFQVIHNGSVLETLDRAQAFREGHEGAVLLHRGETYIVERLDLKERLCYVRKQEVNFSTQAIKGSDLRIAVESERIELGPRSLCLGELEVRECYTGYKIKQYGRILGRKPLDLPPMDFRTHGFWFTVPLQTGEKLRHMGLDFMGGLHALEHAMIGIMPLPVMCDRNDIGGHSTNMHPDTQAPTIFVYDGYEGGIGIAEKAFEKFSEIITMTFELISDCTCLEGCPACILSPKCGSDNKPMDKQAALKILEELILIGQLPL